jgi:hypothetical protein
MSAKEFRELADKCIAWAKTAKSDKGQREFLRMAQAWLKAADLLDVQRRSQMTTPASSISPG